MDALAALSHHIYRCFIGAAMLVVFFLKKIKNRHCGAFLEVPQCWTILKILLSSIVALQCGELIFFKIATHIAVLVEAPQCVFLLENKLKIQGINKICIAAFEWRETSLNKCGYVCGNCAPFFAAFWHLLSGVSLINGGVLVVTNVFIGNTGKYALVRCIFF